MKHALESRNSGFRPHIIDQFESVCGGSLIEAHTLSIKQISLNYRRSFHIFLVSISGSRD